MNDMARYRVGNDPVTLAIPSYWTFYEPPPEIALLALAPAAEDSFSAQVTVSCELVTEGTDVVGYVTGAVALLTNSLTHFVLHESGTIEVDNNLIAWIHFSAVADGDDFTAIEYYVIHGNKGYIIDCKARSDDFLNWKHVFEQIGGSIRLESGF